MSRAPSGRETPLLASCFDASYVPHVATAICSAAESACGRLRWLLVADVSVNQATRRRLLDFARDCGIDAEPLQIPERLVDGVAEIPPYPQLVWHRLALPDVLSAEEQILYLDGDVLILQDLHPLWATELDPGDLFGAIAQPTYSDVSGEYRRLRRPFEMPYLNTGVLLMDLSRMRAERVLEQVVAFVASDHRPALRTPEQDALNLLFPDRWTALDPRWNCMTSMFLPFVFDGASWTDDHNYSPLDLERAVRSPAIVHFEGLPKLKPWHSRSLHPAAKLYRSYRSMTPWPLERTWGGRKDAALSRLPPRVQARIWSVMRRAIDRRSSRG